MNHFSAISNIWRTIYYLIEKYEFLYKYSLDVLNKFTNFAEYRHRDFVPDLSFIIGLYSFFEDKIDSAKFMDAYISECSVRNVKWYKKDTDNFAADNIF